MTVGVVVEEKAMAGDKTSMDRGLVCCVCVCTHVEVVAAALF